MDEEFGQQLRASQERPCERAGRLPELWDGEATPLSTSLLVDVVPSSDWLECACVCPSDGGHGDQEC